MPRQLPWVRTATKHQLQSAKPPIASDNDDDFFDGTILATDVKDKEKALSSEGSSDSGDYHPCNSRKRRALSSSPSVAELPAPRTDNMRMALSRFDLRDDEWMMVENELLETANLFTHHLHMAEYKIIQQNIEQKKKRIDTGPMAARSVVVGAGLSAEGALKERVRVQDERQRRAFRDVFAPRDEDDEPQSPARTEVVEIPSITPASSDTDSDDLDAPLRPSRSTASRPTAPGSISSTSPTSKSFGPRATNHISSPFTKPTPAPQTIVPRLKNRSLYRATPFDMLENYLPKGSHSSTVAAATTETHPQPTPIEKPSRVPSLGRKPRRSVQLLEEWDFKKAHGSSEVANETQGRLTKEKGSGKRKAANIGDDIPTFLL
jgi:hypothetical protein